MDLKNIDKKYRAVPFWSWNDKLDVDETRRQVGIMDEAGIGGFMMHARGGLLTEYMGEEWFDNISVAISEAKARGMHPFAYDENGWPSGFAGGKVTDLGIDYQQKILCMRDAGEEKHPYSLLIRDGREYYLDINPYYVDVLDPKVVAKFIEEVYEVYYERCGNSFDGFFTDEPQMMNGRGGFPWSFTLEDKFKKKYGYSLTESLDALFLEKENTQRVRRDYWYLVTKLFSESFFEQIGTWCRAHGYAFTGHLMMEDSMLDQLRSSGAAMPHYEYFTHPGMDWLGRRTDEDLTPIQVGSAAAQMGQKQVLSETFALAGHNVTLAELKGIYEQQLVHGINLLCTHLEGYSNKGKRKRDYPPALYFQQPWWDDAKIFFDSMARVGMILSEGEISADTLLIHPISRAWEIYNGEVDAAARERMNVEERALRENIRTLEDKHILFHLGDEIMMERHAHIKDGKLVIGEMSYSTVIVPEGLELFESTKGLLCEFEAQGGKILNSSRTLPASTVIPECHITYTKRTYPDFDVHYFVNTNSEPVETEISVGNLILNIETGECEPFSGKVRLERHDSALIIDTHEARKPVTAEKPAPVLNISGEWEVKSATCNSLTLDRCDWRADGGEWQENIYVLDILPRLNLLRRASVLEQKYHFTCECVPEEMFLVTETPELFEICINGKPLEKRDVGYFRDTSFRMLPIAELVRVGENEIYLKSTVSQSEACYRHIDKSWTCETMRNCLAFDTEIEQIYIAGNFGVRLPEDREELPRGAYRIKESPVIAAMPKSACIESLDLSGFPTFSGTLTLERRFNISDPHTRVKLKGRGISSVHLKVNGRDAGTRMWSPYELDISEYLTVGENILELTVINNLRNMQGPFHLRCGESFEVAPNHFYREDNIIVSKSRDESCHDVLEWWDDGICLVHFGLDKSE